MTRTGFQTGHEWCIKHIGFPNYFRLHLSLKSEEVAERPCSPSRLSIVRRAGRSGYLSQGLQTLAPHRLRFHVLFLLVFGLVFYCLFHDWAREMDTRADGEGEEAVAVPLHTGEHPEAGMVSDWSHGRRPGPPLAPHVLHRHRRQLYHLLVRLLVQNIQGIEGEMVAFDIAKVFARGKSDAGCRSSDRFLRRKCGASLAPRILNTNSEEQYLQSIDFLSFFSFYLSRLPADR